MAVDGTEGFTGGTSHGTIELGLGHKADSLWLGGKKREQLKSRLLRPTRTHKRHEQHSKADQ